jgi:cytochrome b subunit of formate dehydrogenase
LFTVVYVRSVNFISYVLFAKELCLLLVLPVTGSVVPWFLVLAVTGSALAVAVEFSLYTVHTYSVLLLLAQILVLLIMG